MSDNSNIGYAFPLEKLGSDIARNDYNYQSILNGLIEWNNTTADTVNIRLTKDSTPWFEDYQIPSKKSIVDVNGNSCHITGTVYSKSFVDCDFDTVIYGGSKQIRNTTINSNTDVNTTSDEFTLSNSFLFDIDDTIKFELSVGTSLPTGIVSTQLYYIVSKTNDNIQVSETFGGTPINLTDTGNGVFTIYKNESLLLSDNDDPGDIVTIRTSVDNNGNSLWDIFQSSIIYTWTSGDNYKANNIVKYNNTYYLTRFDVNNASITPNIDTASYIQVITEWNESLSNDYISGELVIDDITGDLYIVKENITTSIIRPSESELFELYANKFIAMSNYKKGQYVIDSGLLYVAQTDIINTMIQPSVDTNGNWIEMVLLKVPTSITFNNSRIVRWYAINDSNKVLLRNSGDNDSNEFTDIKLNVSIKTKEPSSIYQKSVDVFSTSNYSLWPTDNNRIWATTSKYGPTDETISITKRQNYSAGMIFDHTRMDITKTVNYVNYDGPDLDQGLCIYLPVEVNIAESGIAYPEDGFSFDFFFRIWPNASLNDQITRDHIINKAHIYVYSAPNKDSIYSDECGEPIAKFSMARMTNFYMFGENVAIPDKPVCYRASFKYSEVEQRWCTFDYYQLPDHIFVGPVGFIDPQNPGNLDINNDVIGNINPNATHIGYETAAFPMFQDPFSNADLTPYKASGEFLENFKNRIISE